MRRTFRMISVALVASLPDPPARLALAAEVDDSSGTGTEAAGIDTFHLPETIVTGRQDSLIGIAAAASEGTVGEDQLQYRTLSRPGEILETVPGLIITQHSGGGKANQYFLRGFNLDHGTDFATSVNGVPVQPADARARPRLQRLELHDPRLGAAHRFPEGRLLRRSRRLLVRREAPTFGTTTCCRTASSSSKAAATDTCGSSTPRRPRSAPDTC